MNSQLNVNRKKRDWLGFILSWLAGSVMLTIVNLSPPVTYIFFPIAMFCSYEAIRCIVTYDITKWKNAKLWIWLGGVFGVIGSFIVYLFLRRKKT